MPQHADTFVPCHHPDRINDGRPETLALLKKAGYRTVRELAGGVWTDMEI